MTSLFTFPAQRSRRRADNTIRTLLTLFGLGDDSSNDAGTIGEVTDDAYVRKTRLAAELGRGVEGALIELAGKQAAGAQHIGRRIEQAAEDIKAIGAALERQIGLKVLDLVRQRAHDVSRDIRRVGNEHVEGAPLLAGDRAHQVREAEGDLIGRHPECIAVFGGQVDGARLDIGSGAGDMAATLPIKG